eukprot:TRINITY_DN9964_c0_g1_i1.p1 TRINITY_DN9964_c0_g1~~TRINITY_DN9964_c0_g1_i1.p1  ORF type:complete len:629 (-),score=78.45 TRINITY_DN9964_c0_g1_i1:64-1950(-)
MGSQAGKHQCCVDDSVEPGEDVLASSLCERSIVESQPVPLRQAEESTDVSEPEPQALETKQEHAKEPPKMSLEHQAAGTQKLEDAKAPPEMSLEDQAPGTKLEDASEPPKMPPQKFTNGLSSVGEEGTRQTAGEVQHGADEVMPKLKSDGLGRVAHPLVKAIFSPTGGRETGSGFWKVPPHKVLLSFPIGLTIGLFRFLPMAIYWEDKLMTAMATSFMSSLPLSVMLVGLFAIWFDQALPAWHFFILTPMPAIPTTLLINLTDLNGFAVCPIVFMAIVTVAITSVLMDARRTSWPLKPLVIGMVLSLHCLLAGNCGGWIVMWLYAKILTDVGPVVASLCFNPMFFCVKAITIFLSFKNYEHLKRNEVRGLARDLKGRVKTMENFVIHANIETGKMNTLLASIVLAPNMAWLPSALINIIVKVLTRSQWFEVFLYMVCKRFDTKDQKLLRFCMPSVRRDTFLDAMMPASWCSLTGPCAILILRLVAGVENPLFNNDFPIALFTLMGIGLAEDIIVYVMEKTSWTGVRRYWASSKELQHLCESEGYDGEKYFLYGAKKSCLSTESVRPLAPMIYCVTQFAIQAFISAEALTMWLSVHFLVGKCSTPFPITSALDNGFFYYSNAAFCPHAN